MLGLAAVYVGLGLYGAALLLQIARSKMEDMLELSSHLAMVLFLSLALHSLDNETYRKQIDMSVAILVLSACLVSFIFGLSLGKSWGRAPSAAAMPRRGKDTSSKDAAPGGVVAESAAARAPDGRDPGRDGGARPRLFSDESVDGDSLATPSFARGDPFLPPPNAAALLLSPLAKTDTIDTFEGYQISRDFIDSTVDILTTIVGVSSKVETYSNKKWSLMTISSNGSYLWTNSDKRDGIMLKASALCATPAKAVVRWLLDRQMGTGLEGIMYRSETLLMNEKENICIQRFVCKSDRVLLSSRCFLVVTAWKRLGDGSYIVATRSLPAETGKAADKKSVRGCVYASGYLIRSLSEATEGHNTEVLFGAHVSFSRSGKSNIDKTKLGEISKYISKILGQATLGAADPYNEIEESPEPVGSKSKDTLDLSKEQRSEVLLVARDTLSKLELTHRSVSTDSGGGALLFGSLSSTHQELSVAASLSSSSWNDIYNQDGITVSEWLDDTKTIGTLRASCTIDAPPAVIHELLTQHSEIIDNLVEQKMVLAQLNSKTSLQWIAYGSVWPVGAFDFLVVTVDDTCANSKGEVGFVIVSTSIDGIVDEEEAPPEKGDTEDSASESGAEDDKKPTFRSDRSKYSRSSLRMAGYVGQPNGRGGTELTLYLDLDLYAYIPAWLMQLLAQNGLSEMMGRLREAAVLMNKGQDPLSLASKSKIGSMLSQIQVREEKLRHLKGGEEGSKDKVFVAEPTERKRPKSVDVAKDKNIRSASDEGAALQAPKPALVKGGVVDVDALRKMDFAGKGLKRLMKYTGQTPVQNFPLDWTIKLTKNGISIAATPIVNSTWNALKAELVVSADIDILRKLLVDDSRVGEYDDMFDSCEMICRLSDNSAIRRMTFKAVWPTQPRDFIVCTSWSQLDDGSVAITTMSVPDEVCPPRDGFVRGTVNISGYVIAPTTSEGGAPGLNVTLCLHTDLGGSLPVGIINMLATSAPIKMLTTINQIARQESTRR